MIAAGDELHLHAAFEAASSAPRCFSRTRNGAVLAEIGRGLERLVRACGRVQALKSMPASVETLRVTILLARSMPVIWPRGGANSANSNPSEVAARPIALAKARAAIAAKR